MRWTPEEDAILLAGRREGLTYEQIAETMPRRSASGCCDRINTLGKSPTKRGPQIREDSGEALGFSADDLAWRRDAALGSAALLKAMHRFYDRRAAA